MVAASQVDSFRNSVTLGKKNPGIVTPQGLERLLAFLAENVQTSMGAFYNVHKALMVNRKTPNSGMEQFKQTKHIFRTECESLRQVLQTAYRHAVDFTTSCQHAPNARFMSAKRCQLSGKGVLRDLQNINREYDRSLDDFRTQEEILIGYLTVKPKRGERPSSADMSRGASEHPEVAVSMLFTALEDVQLSLRDILAYWENHANFLTLVVNRQSNFPAPGNETKATVELWARYQAAFLQSSSSISQSADALSVDPSINPMNEKRHRRFTHPATASDRRPDLALPPKNDTQKFESKHKPEPETETGANQYHLPLSHWFKSIKRMFGRT